jgi:hypothetical protein
MEGGHDEQQQAHALTKKGGAGLIPIIIGNDL